MENNNNKCRVRKKEIITIGAEINTVLKKKHTEKIN